MNTQNERDFVQKTIKSRDVHFIRLWFTDIFGTLKQFSVIPNEIDVAFEEGMGFDGSAIAGFGCGDTREMIALPDPESFQVIPWRPQTNSVARMFCDIYTPSMEPFEGDSRSILRRVVEQAASKGYIMNVGPELEYYYFKDSNNPDPIDEGSYFDIVNIDGAADLRRDTIMSLEKMGIPVEYTHHEGGPSQYEIDLRYSDALSMADNLMTYKTVVKTVAHAHGYYASFMPQPLKNQPGNGMHVHQSLCDFDGRNLFFDKDDPQGYRLSALAKHYLAGILRYASEFCLITNPCVNSYKRLANPYRAARHVTWAYSSRTSLARIPAYKPFKESSCRIEIRNPDSAANPYLCFACMLAAGLKGIEDKLELVSPTEAENLQGLSRVELARRGISSLPENMGEALDLFESSEFMRRLLGEKTHAYIVEAKREEWLSYMQFVSQWEIKRYLPLL